jgi:Chaperone of endosialidase
MEFRKIIFIFLFHSFAWNLSAQERSYAEIDFKPRSVVPNPRGIDPNIYDATFVLQNNAVKTPAIKDSAVTSPKIGDGQVPITKLNATGTNAPVDGYTLKWSGTNFFFSPDIPSAPPGGGVQSISTVSGSGIFLDPNPVVATGTVWLDIGIEGDNKIPYFNDSSELILSDQVDLIFRKDPEKFILRNSGALEIEGSLNNNLFTLELSGRASFIGPISVGGVGVCMSNGTNCPLGVTAITKVETTFPITGGGDKGSLTVGASVGTATNQLLWLDPILGGALPAVDGSQLLNVVHEVLPGSAISVSNLLGSATVGLRFGGPGLAQSWAPRLDNLGTLNPLLNNVILGQATSTFDVFGGSNLQSKLNLLPGRDVQVYYKGLKDIANIGYPPTGDKYISGNGTAWQAKVIPNCASGFIVLGGNNNFNCSDASNNFIAATFISNADPGMEIKAKNGGAGPPGELRFFGTNAKYVGIKSPTALATDTTWTLPTADGASGTYLSTNGTKGLSFISNNNGDVSGPAASSATYIPIFSDNTGKVLKNQTVLMVDSANSRVGIGTSTPGNKLSINTTANGQGIEVGKNFLGRCGLGANFACFSYPTLNNSITDYAFAQENNGATYLNAKSGQGIYFRINNANEGIVDSSSRLGIGTTSPTKPLHVAGTAGDNGAILGNAYIGQTATHGNAWAGFLYSGLGDNSYALFQNNAGITLLNAATDQYIGFRINNSDKMHMNKDGALGIGTTAPGEKLTVSAGNLRIEGSVSPTIVLRSTQSNAANSGEVVFLESDTNFGFKIRHNSTNAGAPSNSTDILQFYRFSNAIETQIFQMAATGQLWARVTTIGALSDQTIKKDISDFSGNAGDIIGKFRPIKFYWEKSSPTYDNIEHIGFLAQEVEKIDPRFVKTNPILNKLMIKYDEILPLMITHLKELNSENEELEKKIRDRSVSEKDLKLLQIESEQLDLELAKLEKI